jgi:hypothetical protein
MNQKKKGLSAPPPPPDPSPLARETDIATLFHQLMVAYPNGGRITWTMAGVPGKEFRYFHVDAALGEPLDDQGDGCTDPVGESDALDQAMRDALSVARHEARRKERGA